MALLLCVGCSRVLRAIIRIQDDPLIPAFIQTATVFPTIFLSSVTIVLELLKSSTLAILVNDDSFESNTSHELQELVLKGVALHAGV